MSHFVIVLQEDVFEIGITGRIKLIGHEHLITNKGIPSHLLPELKSCKKDLIQSYSNNYQIPAKVRQQLVGLC